MLSVASRMLRIASRAAILFLAIAATLLGGMWTAKRWLGWDPPAPLSAIFGESVQQAEALLYVYDKDTGWKMNPYTQLHWVSRGPFQKGEPQEVRLRTNSEGFFDREHYLATDYYRIAFLGDSWVEAEQVDPSQRFTDLVEGYVFASSKGERAVETMNFGVGNLGTAQEYGVVKHYVLKYRPNEIWILFNPANDVMDSTPLFTSPPLGPTFQYGSGGEIVDIRFGYPHPPAVTEALRRERYKDWVALTTAQVWPFLYAQESHPAFDVAFAETRSSLRLIKKLADGIGAKVVVAYLPAKLEYDAAEWADFQERSRGAIKRDVHFDRALGEQRVSAMAGAEGAEFLSLKPLLLEKGTHEVLQGHFSRMGHHWVADLIARRLVASDCCKRPKPR